MTFTASDQLLAIETGLAAAKAKVRAAEVRRCMAVAIERFALTVAITGVAAIVATAVTRFAGSDSHAPFVIVLACGAVAGAFVVGQLVLSLMRAQTPWKDVAEQLDLAAKDHNAIATALEIARSEDDSPMAQQAIQYGLAVLRANAVIEPFVPKSALLAWRTWPPLIGGVALLAVSLLLPVRFITTLPDHGAADQIALAAVPLDGTTPRNNKKIEPPQNRPQPQAFSPSAAVAKQASAAPQIANPSADRPATSANAGSSNSNPASAAMESSATPQSQKADPRGQESRPAAPQAETPPNAAARAAPSIQKAAVGQNSSDSQSNSNAKASSGGSKAQSPSGEPSGSKSDESSNSGSSDADALPAPPGDEGSQSQGGQNGSDKGAEAPGSGNGRSSQAGEGAGGNGQSSGQSPPKKARGVAPLMLGSRQADLLQSPPLPGPDQRTRIQMPPTPQPLDPDAAADARNRAGPEPVTGVYRVPADRRSAVDSYFQRFHQDAAKQ